MHENDILEYFQEIESIQIIDQLLYDHAAMKLATRATIDWVISHGFEPEQAEKMVYKSLKKTK